MESYMQTNNDVQRTENFKGTLCTHTRIENLATKGTEQDESIYLLFGDAHLVCNIRENCGLDEVAFIPPGASTAFQFGPFFLPTLNEVKYFFILFLVNLFEKYHTERKISEWIKKASLWK